jgi:YbbR domain-containing protein
VYVRLEDELVRRLPVSPHLDVKPQPGYLVAGPVQTQPESVVVSGPRSEVERLDSVRTVEKVMIGLAENRTEEVDLVNPTEKTQVSPRRVRATIRIDKLGERSLTRVPLVAENVPEGRSVLLEPSAINVRVRGPSTRLASLTPDSLLGVVDLADWEPGVRDYRPRMQSPADVEVVELTPDRVRVRMERLEGEE